MLAIIWNILATMGLLNLLGIIVFYCIDLFGDEQGQRRVSEIDSNNIEKQIKDYIKSKQCDHTVGYQSNRHTIPCLIRISSLDYWERQGWRGSVTMQCEICGINMWEWQEFTDKDGKYSKKVYVGKKLN